MGRHLPDDAQLKLINAMTSSCAVPFAVAIRRPVAVVAVVSAQLSRLSRRGAASKVDFGWVAWCGCLLSAADRRPLPLGLS
ncbi:hypothetical protein Acsp01_59310 [Actinoplanes sp. NBRC 101535]|nr:hypothetical protein Acsp01_59310 [Actinoplanes sp. NBRC 101535]